MVPIPAPPPDVAQDLVPACMVQAARDYSLPLRGLIAVSVSYTHLRAHET